ncbi:MAG: M23 family metallopeptidase [Clostridia bacterium]
MIDPATAKVIAKVVISQITDEEKRQRLVIGIVILLVVIILIIMLPILLLTSTLDKIQSFFGVGDNDEINSSYDTVLEMRAEYGNEPESEKLIFNGSLPMPVNNANITSEYGARLHPVTGKNSFHTGIDLAGAWHSNILSVLNGKIVFAGVQKGYGNCIEIEHKENGETFYTFYAHLARIDITEEQEVKQGTVIAIQGGDPKKDPNPRIFYWDTFTL